MTKPIYDRSYMPESQPTAQIVRSDGGGGIMVLHTEGRWALVKWKDNHTWVDSMAPSQVMSSWVTHKCYHWDNQIDISYRSAPDHWKCTDCDDVVPAGLQALFHLHNGSV